MTPFPMTLIPHPAVNLEVTDVPRYDQLSLGSVPQLKSPIFSVLYPCPRLWSCAAGKVIRWT